MDQHRTAVHEAGHVLVAYLEEFEVGTTTITKAGTPNGSAKGGVKIPDLDSVDQWPIERHRSYARVLYAGKEAENVVLDDGGALISSFGDDSNILQKLGEEYGQGPHHFFSKELKNSAVEILETHRSVLEDLSDFIEEEGTVSGKELTRFLNERLD